ARTPQTSAVAPVPFFSPEVTARGIGNVRSPSAPSQRLRARTSRRLVRRSVGPLPRRRGRRGLLGGPCTSRVRNGRAASLEGGTTALAKTWSLHHHLPPLRFEGNKGPLGFGPRGGQIPCRGRDTGQPKEGGGTDRNPAVCMAAAGEQ